MSKVRLWQFGKVTRTRAGLQGHSYFEDEPTFVDYTDYKYWIRFTPWSAFGWNLPFLGYFKRGDGWHRRIKV